MRQFDGYTVNRSPYFFLCSSLAMNILNSKQEENGGATVEKQKIL
jgi:hypothetical protein